MMPSINPFFSGQMDYVFFLYGLSFFLVGIFSFIVYREGREAVLWKWAALFGISHGLLEWIDMFILILGESQWLQIPRVFFLLASFYFCIEAWRGQLQKKYGRFFSPLFFMLLAVPLGIGWQVDRVSGLITFARYFWGVPGAVGAGVVFFAQARTRDRAIAKWYGILGGILLLYAASQTVVPRAGFFPASVWNQDVFLQYTGGIPVQVFRTVCAMAGAVIIWLYVRFSYLTQATHFTNMRSAVTLGVFFVLLFSGWLFTAHLGELRKKEIAVRLVRDSRMIAAAVDPRRVIALAGAATDIGTPNYERIKEEFRSIRDADRSIRFIYLLGLRGGDVFFYVDSEDAGASDSSPAGQVWTEAPAAARECFLQGKSGVVGPYTDRWGTWVSCFVPVKDVAADMTVGVVGVDIDATTWQTQVFHLRLYGILVTMVVFILVASFFAISQLRLIAYEVLRQSEQRLRLHIEETPLGVVEWDVKFRVTQWNPSAERIFGYTAAEMLGNDGRFLFPESTRTETKALGRYLWGRRKEKKITIPGITKEGREILCDWYNTPLVARSGRVVGVASLVEDITQRNNAQERLRQAAAEWQRTFDSIGDFIFIMDTESRIIKANKSFIESYGDGDEKNLIGRRCFEVLHHRASHWPGCPLPCTLETHRSHAEEVDDPVIGIPLLVTTSPILDPHGTLVGIVHIARDISELKKAEKQLREAIEMKTQFISMASHELRTPLTAIKESIDIVGEAVAGTIDDDIKDFFNVAKRNIDRLSRLINNILDFQKLEAGKVVFHFEEHNLNEVVKEVRAMMAPLARERGLELTADLCDDMRMVRLDKDKIIQVLTNLMNNAIKFTDRGTITVITQLSGNTVLVRVMDTGPGIRKEDLAQLFQKFQQVGSPSTRKTGGTGLGLAISKEIIEQHKGKMWVESEPGIGSTFSFLLPIEERRV